MRFKFISPAEGAGKTELLGVKPLSALPAGTVPAGCDEAFACEITPKGALLYADGELAEGWAKQALGQTEGRCGLYASWPDFERRGVIEGFYGRPWTMAERRRALKFMAEHGMNEYVYAPKDDPFHRDRWNELYGPGDADVLRELIGIAEENGLRFSYMLAPGLSIKYTSEGDLRALEEKYKQVWSFGVRRFGLLLDDLERATLYPEDAAVYSRQVDAHIALVNRIWGCLHGLDEDNTLIVCPTQYWGDTSGEYISALGRGIPAEVSMFFTGRLICSDGITSGEARAFAESTGHRPVYWDNYPVNDAEMIDELHVGAITGREADLGEYCGGLIANPMEFAFASLISIYTIADYLWDSHGYSPEASCAAAVTELMGAEYVEPMKTLDEFCYKSCLTRWGHHFRYIKPLRGNERFDAAKPDVMALRSYIRSSAEKLEKLAGTPLAENVARWYDTAREFCAAALEAIERREPERLRAYLARPEDIMKREAAYILSFMPTQTICCKQTPDGELSADIYAPTKQASASPAFIYFHGGGWSGGNRGEPLILLPLITRLRAEGVTLISCDYRLVKGERRFPTPVDDCVDAFRFFYNSAERFGLDRARFFVGGASAGGHLSLMAAFAGSEFGETERTPYSVAAIVDLCGPVDLSRREPAVSDQKESDAILARFLGPDDGEIARRASPITYISKSSDRLPPLIAVQGSEDELVHRSQPLILERVWAEAGAPFELVSVVNGAHDFGQVEGLPAPSMSYGEIMEKLYKFIRKYVLEK